MKNSLAAFITTLLLFAVAPACSHLQVPIISTIKDCANNTTASVAANIKTDVGNALICEAGNLSQLPPCVISGLEAIAKRSGWSAVDCVIWKIETGETSTTVVTSEKAALDPNLRVKRAQAAATWRANQPS